MREIEGNSLHPEGLTNIQEELATELATTKIYAKVKRREQSADGTYRFYNIMRDTYPFEFNAQEGEFAFKLHQDNPGAPLSPEYFNFRNLPENLFNLIGRNFAELKIENRPRLCTGIPDAGAKIAKAYSSYSGVPYIEIFRKIENENKRQIIAVENNISGDTGLEVFDDVVTKALSIFETTKAANSMGFKKLMFSVVVDREEGGVDRLLEAGYLINFIYKHSQLLDICLRKELRGFNKAKYDEIKKYLAISRLI